MVQPSTNKTEWRHADELYLLRPIPISSFGKDTSTWPALLAPSNPVSCFNRCHWKLTSLWMIRDRHWTGKFQLASWLIAIARHPSRLCLIFNRPFLSTFISPGYQEWDKSYSTLLKSVLGQLGFTWKARNSTNKQGNLYQRTHHKIKIQTAIAGGELLWALTGITAMTQLILLFR